MGKTKQTNPKKGTSRGTRASQGLGPCIQNKDFVARLRAIKDRTVIFERGIQEGVAELPNDKMAVGDRTDINQRSWKDSASKTNGRKKQKRALEDTQGDEEQDPKIYQRRLQAERLRDRVTAPFQASLSGSSMLSRLFYFLVYNERVVSRVRKFHSNIDEQANGDGDCDGNGGPPAGLR
ncbi:hypothetical protein Q3G72_024331 [Acer saccharum]|nr:hypothetical protein Q3G72_024331 [Acer saccharum]